MLPRLVGSILVQDFCILRNAKFFLLRIVPKIGYFFVFVPSHCLAKSIMSGFSYRRVQRSARLKSKQDKTVRNKTMTDDKMIKSKGLTVAGVLKSISDPISVELFKSISTQGSDGSALRSKTKLSRRQYYSRLSCFTRNGMLVRKNGRNYRTTFGKVVYHTILTIENAFANYYKLKAIDSIGLSYDIPQEEHKKIIDNLITDPEIRQILLTKKS